MSVREDLERLERAGWDSLCDGTAADFYGEVTTTDGVMVLANGMSMLHTGTAHRDDGSSNTATMTSTYVDRDGSWRLALCTQTPAG